MSVIVNKKNIQDVLRLRHGWDIKLITLDNQILNSQSKIIPNTSQYFM